MRNLPINFMTLVKLFGLLFHTENKLRVTVLTCFVILSKGTFLKIPGSAPFSTHIVSKLVSPTLKPPLQVIYSHYNYNYNGKRVVLNNCNNNNSNDNLSLNNSINSNSSCKCGSQWKL